MSYIEIKAEQLIQAVKEQKQKLLEIDKNAKEIAIKDAMSEKIGWWFNWRLLSQEEATIDVNRWWDRSQALRGINSSLNRLKKLEGLAQTSQKLGNGVVHLNKDDNLFVFGDLCD